MNHSKCAATSRSGKGRVTGLLSFGCGVLMAFSAAGCSADGVQHKEERAATVAQRTISSTSVASASATYARGEDVTITFSGLPGNAYDYVAIAPEGSALTGSVAYQYGAGATGGSFNMGAVANGTYVARAFADNSQTLLAESAPFTIGPTVPTVAPGLPSFGAGDDVVILFDVLPGNANDYIAIAPQGADAATYVTYRYTASDKNGSFNFGSLADGTYVARAFVDNTHSEWLAESAPFIVGANPGAPAVSPHLPSFGTGEDVVIDFSALPGNANDYVEITTPGAHLGQKVAYRYAAGATSGSLNFGTIADGTYIVRAFSDNSLTELAESPPFTIGTSAPPAGGPTLSSGSTSYAAGSSVLLDFSALPGSASDFIVIAQQGSPSSAYVAYRYTGGAASGSFDMGAVADGTYVARAFESDTSTLLTESAPFTVGAAAPPAFNPALSSKSATYAAGSSVMLDFDGLLSSSGVFIVIAPQDAPNATYVTYRYTDGAASGSLDMSAVAPGTYVARVFQNDTTTLLAESASFTVAP